LPAAFGGGGKAKPKNARAQKIPLGCGAKGNFLRPRRRGNFLSKRSYSFWLYYRCLHNFMIRLN